MGLAVLRAVGIGRPPLLQRRARRRPSAATLRDRVSDRYRDLALGYHRATPTGELLAHMEADVEAAIEVLYPIPFSIGAICASSCSRSSPSSLTDPFLTLIGLLMIPALALMNRSFARRMQGPARRAQERIGDVSAVAHESIDGALVVKTLGPRAGRGRAPRASGPSSSGPSASGRGYIRAGFEPALEALPSIATILHARGRRLAAVARAT